MFLLILFTLFCFINKVFSFIVLENELVIFNFDSNTGALIDLIDKKSNINVIGSNASKLLSNIDLTLVNDKGELTLGELKNVQYDLNKIDNVSILNLIWNKVELTQNDNDFIAYISLKLSIILDDTTISKWDVSFNVIESLSTFGEIGIWESNINLPLSIGSNSDGSDVELFYPWGFGAIYPNPSISTGISGHSNTYPSGGASMNFMALGSKVLSTGAYFAALDGKGEQKILTYSKPLNNKNNKNNKILKSSSEPINEKDNMKTLKWSNFSCSYNNIHALSITTYPPNAGLPIKSYKAPYKIAIGIISNINFNKGRTLWSEASIIYREWTLNNSKWTQQGPLNDERRKKEYPSWYRNNNIWINTHWQCLDIFNTTGGDPNFVVNNAIEIAKRLNQSSLNLHWYEWQQGPSPLEEDRYLFDTHYPDYFPARNNFKNSVNELLKYNISTFPYINGRISDLNSNSYLTENGSQYCTKKTTEVKVLHEHMTSSPELIAYEESYGSNATFCVTNPFTSYWQNKLADTVEELVKKYDVPGVYIDQIASAGPKQCWDNSHQHDLGGGDYWTLGYAGMMDTIDERLKDLNKAYPMVAEDNAEPYMSMLQGYLTLNAFKPSFSTQQNSDQYLNNIVHLVPAFPFIYGGYYIGFGAIWTRADFVNHNFWCSKLAITFATGTQLGWFSLVGVDNSEDSCGPMGVGDLLMSSDNDDLIEFIQVLSKYRTKFINYFVDGHIIFPPVFNPIPPVFTITSESQDILDYDSVVSQSWIYDKTNSILVVLVGTTEEVYVGEIYVDISTCLDNYNKENPLNNKSSYNVEIIITTSSLHIELKQEKRFININSDGLYLLVNVPARGILTIEIIPIF